MSKEKKCSRCGRVLELTEFNKDARTPDGHRYDCKLCQYEGQRKHLEKKIEEKRSEYDRTK